MVLGVAERRAAASNGAAGEISRLDDDDVGRAEAEVEGAQEAGGGEEVGGDERRRGREERIGVGAVGVAAGDDARGG